MKIYTEATHIAVERILQDYDFIKMNVFTLADHVAEIQTVFNKCYDVLQLDVDDKPAATTTKHPDFCSHLRLLALGDYNIDSEVHVVDMHMLYGKIFAYVHNNVASTAMTTTYNYFVNQYYKWAKTRQHNVTYYNCRAIINSMYGLSNNSFTKYPFLTNYQHEFADARNDIFNMFTTNAAFTCIAYDVDLACLVVSDTLKDSVNMIIEDLKSKYDIDCTVTVSTLREADKSVWLTRELIRLAKHD